MDKISRVPLSLLMISKGTFSNTFLDDQVTDTRYVSRGKLEPFLLDLNHNIAVKGVRVGAHLKIHPEQILASDQEQSENLNIV